MQVTGLFVYPVKSLQGFSVQEWFVEARGLRYDRRWMIVDPQGVFRTQRQTPAMATIGTRLTPDALILKKAGHGSFSVSLQPEGDPVNIRVWSYEGPAFAVSPLADEWLSDALGEPCRLVTMGPDTNRCSSPEYAGPESPVSFADGFPILLTSEESLADLNARLEVSVPMDRFRPNVVVAGGTAWAEDELGRFQVGRIMARNVKACGRCVVTTTDQQTGVRQGAEPLHTLASFRRQGKSVNFGVNIVVDSEGQLAIGDHIKPAN